MATNYHFIKLIKNHHFVWIRRYIKKTLHSRFAHFEIFDKIMHGQMTEGKEN